jgi:hypothetical protein
MEAAMIPSPALPVLCAAGGEFSASPCVLFITPGLEVKFFPCSDIGIQCAVFAKQISCFSPSVWLCIILIRSTEPRQIQPGDSAQRKEEAQPEQSYG